MIVLTNAPEVCLVLTAQYKMQPLSLIDEAVNMHTCMCLFKKCMYYTTETSMTVQGSPGLPGLDIYTYSED